MSQYRSAWVRKNAKARGKKKKTEKVQKSLNIVFQNDEVSRYLSRKENPQNARRLTYWETPASLPSSRRDNVRGLAVHSRWQNNSRRQKGSRYHPPLRLLPDLAPAHYFLLARLKLRLKGRHFTDASENSTNREDGAWAAITLDAFSAAAVNTPPAPPRVITLRLCINNLTRDTLCKL